MAASRGISEHVLSVTQEGTLLTSHRGKTNSARNLALSLLRRYTPKTLTEIGRYYDIANDSIVSSTIVRAQKTMRENETVCKG
jgi:chromosomal replication initiation ATPase DnaA